MKHIFRFLGTRIAQGLWEISGEELQHLKKVLRLGPGDKIEVFDGNGTGAEVVLERVGAETAVAVGESIFSESLPDKKLILCLSALRPGAVDDLLAPLVELGVDGIQVFLGYGSAKIRLHDRSSGRWRRIVLAAAKQSKRLYLPDLHCYADVKEFIAGCDAGARRVVLDASASHSALSVKLDNGALYAVVGGEAGLDNEESEQLLNNGFQPLSLGKFTLRATTAAIAAAALFKLRQTDSSLL